MDTEAIKTATLVITATIALITAFHQFFRFRGARLVLLDQDAEHPQKSTTLKYESLPPEIRNQYPDYHDWRKHYALVRIPVANEGDRAGYVKVLAARLEHGIPEEIDPKTHVRFSYYTYTVVPAFGIGLHTILVRNLPGVEVNTRMRLSLDLELGGVHPWRKGHSVREVMRFPLEVLLQAPNRELLQSPKSEGIVPGSTA